MSDRKPSRQRETHPQFPHSPEAERGVLACALYHPAATFEEASRYISTESFHDPRHGPMWACVAAMHEAGKPLNPETFVIELRHTDKLTEAGGLAYVAEITGTLASPSELPYLVQVLRDAEFCRKGIRVLPPLIPRFYENPSDVEAALDECEKTLFDLIEMRRHGKRAETMAELFARSYGMLADPNPEIGISTGFPELDDATWGMERKELIVLAGGTSDGKSALAQAIVNHACVNDGHRTLYCTREMSSLETLWRLKQIRSGINLRDFLRSEKKNESSLNTLRAVGGKISRSPLYIRDDLSHIREVRAEARAIQARDGKLRFIVVDYDEKFKGDREKGENYERELASISWHSKEMAMETGATVLLLSQITEGENGQRKLRNASAKGNDGNKVWVLNPVKDNPDHPHRMTGTDIEIRKNRDGERGGTVRLGFEGYCTRFFSPNEKGR